MVLIKFKAFIHSYLILNIIPNIFIANLNGIYSKTFNFINLFPFLKRINACELIEGFFVLLLFFLSFCWFLIFSFSCILFLWVLYRVEIHGQYDISPDMFFLHLKGLKIKSRFSNLFKGISDIPTIC